MADIVPRPWRFTQLGGERKVLVLDGPNAPFGRPRRAPVVERERELRESAVYYPGNAVPTRHLFGTRQTSISLSGRFMDSRIGVEGGAKAKDAEVDAFVDDQIPVRIEWGGILALTGLLRRYKASFESEAEIAWTLEAAIDSDDSKPVQAPTTPVDNASQQWADALGKFLNAQANLNPPTLPQDIEFQPSFLDSVANLLSSINSVSANIAHFAEAVDNFESTVFADVERFRAGIHQVSTSIDKLIVTIDSGVNDVGFERASAKSQAEWYQTRAEQVYELQQVQAILALLELTAERVLKGTPDKTVRATGGDTWESIAAANLGSASKADALRQANGVRYGAPPTPGMIIHIPKAS